MKVILLAIAVLVSLGGCASQPAASLSAPSPTASVAPAPPQAKADPVPLGFSLPALAGNVETDVKSVITWLDTQNTDDLTAARDIADKAVPRDIAGFNCHSWALATKQSIPPLGSGVAFADIKGPISAFEKARVVLASGNGGNSGVSGLLEGFNVACSPYIQSINYRAGKALLLGVGVATTGNAATPALGAVQGLIQGLPSLFGAP